jgi:hypothetical protein
LAQSAADLQALVWAARHSVGHLAKQVGHLHRKRPPGAVSMQQTDTQQAVWFVLYWLGGGA